MKENRFISKVFASALVFLLCTVGYSSSASADIIGFDNSVNKAKWVHRIGFSMQLNELDFSNVESRVSDFQSNTRLGIVARPFILMYGCQRYGNLFEVEFKYSTNKLAEFMHEYYSLIIDEMCVHVWYRRSVPLSILGLGVRTFPGISVGYSYTSTYIGPSWDHTEVMYGSSITWAVGVKSEVKIIGWKSASSRYALSLDLDYRYRIDDPVAEHCNGGEIFFPDVSNFNFSDHALLVGLYLRWQDLY